MNVEFVVPDEMELVAFFGTEPVERQVEDGYWCYESSDNRGVTLRFSFDLFEQSVQTAILMDGAPLATVAHEGAQVMAITDQTLTCRFASSGTRTTLVLRVTDSINLEWSTLRRLDG
jgi:hypothetical protein